MAEAYIDIQEPGSPTKKLASQSVTRGVDTVHREEVSIGNAAGNAAIAEVVNAAPTTEYGLVVRPIPSGTQNVADGGGAITVDALDLDIRNLDSNDVPDIADRAARDLGKVDIASLDQYTPVSGRLPVDGSGVTQPISAAALPLPTGAATSAAQLPDGHNVTVDNATGAAAVFTQGSAAHDAAAAGNPVTVAGTHETIADAAPANRLASVTDGDVQRLSTTDGALFVIPSGPQQWKARLTGTMTDTTVKTAPSAGLSLYIQTIVYSIGAATASTILLEESTTTAVFGPHYLEAVNGRGMAISFNPPIKITAATLLSATNSGATTATLDVYGFTAPG